VLGEGYSGLIGIWTRYFFGGEFSSFCRGFWRKWVAERGFLMVNLWWIRGESWLVDGGFLRTKNMPRISDLFFGDSDSGIIGAGFGAQERRIALTRLRSRG
jgi:hypothetical protein